MSLHEKALRELFVAMNIAIIGDIVLEDSTNDVYVQIESFVNPDGTKSPSRKQLLQIKDEFSTRNFKLHILLSSKQEGQFEELLRGTLFLAFPDILRNVFCSLNVGQALVWIETKRELGTELSAAIEKAAEKFCESQEFTFRGMATIGEVDTPGKVAILSALRTIAPATVDELSIRLAKNGFSIPSNDWLNRRLDSYRKSKNIICSSDKKYILAIESLNSLGTSRKGSKSPDVSRLLALWRRS